MSILQIAGENHEKDETAPAFEGLFFNYFSIGEINMSISILLWNKWLFKKESCTDISAKGIA